MRKIKYAVLILTLLIATIISGIYAYTSYEIATVENNLISSAVNIELKEYVKDLNNQEIEIDSLNEHVLPNENIPFIVKVDNKGIKAYLRVKYEYVNATFNINDINMDETNWVKKGDYYYYKNILNESENIVLFSDYTTPADILGSYDFNIIAEAVQSNYFDVDFESDNPWGDFVVEDSIDENYDISAISVQSNTIVDYKDNSKRYLIIPETFMENYSLLKPGDELTDYIEVKNTSSKEIEIFMKNVNLSPELNENYRYLNLKVYDESNNMVYDGNLLQDSLTSLGKYKPGTTNRLRFVLKFRDDNENVTSIKDYKIGWKFYLSELEDEKEIIDIINPYTGDGIIFWIVIFAISLCLLVISIKKFLVIRN